VRLDDAYPNALVGTELPGGYVKMAGDARPCFMCGTLTHWVDLGYEAPLCSPECDEAARKDAAARICKADGYDLVVEPNQPCDTLKFHCATCGCERDLDDLPRVTLTVCTGLTSNPFTQLMCWPCVKIMVKLLHERFCPQDCEEEHEVR